MQPSLLFILFYIISLSPEMVVREPEMVVRATEMVVEQKAFLKENWRAIERVQQMVSP